MHQRDDRASQVPQIATGTKSSISYGRSSAKSAQRSRDFQPYLCFDFQNENGINFSQRDSHPEFDGTNSRLRWGSAPCLEILVDIPLSQKIEAVGNRSIRRSLVGRRAVIGNMQQRIAHLTIFVLGCCELHSQNQAQL
jgi:hypothetical protein